MKYTFIFLILYFNMHAQDNWSLESADGSITVTNYRAFDESLDSVVIKNHHSRLRLLSDSLCENSDGDSCETGTSGVSFISDIDVLDENRYILTALNRYPDGSFLEVLIYNKEANDLDKWLITKSADRFLQIISFYYSKDRNVLLIPKAANQIEDEFIYDVDYKANTFEKIPALKKNFKRIALSDRFENDDAMNNMFFEVGLDVDLPLKIED